MTTYQGSCHCGGVSVSFKTNGDSPLPVRTCGCSFCQRVRPVYTSDPEGSIEMAATAQLHRYRFGQESADFVSCATCGTFLGAVTETDQGLRCVLNVAGVLIKPLLNQAATPMDFSAEDRATRDARRARNWTPLTIDEMS